MQDGPKYQAGASTQTGPGSVVGVHRRSIGCRREFTAEHWLWLIRIAAIVVILWATGLLVPRHAQVQAVAQAPRSIPSAPAEALMVPTDRMNEAAGRGARPTEAPYKPVPPGPLAPNAAPSGSGNTKPVEEVKPSATDGRSRGGPDLGPYDTPAEGDSRTCPATYYGGPDDTVNGMTSMMEAFNSYGMTAAHRTLPAGNSSSDARSSWLTVTNPANGKSVNVRINDYGPSITVGRTKQICIDLAYGAFREIADPSLGRITVNFTVNKLGVGGYRRVTGE